MKILLAGDSTVADCPTQEFPMSGWGAQLPPHTYRWGSVHNFAKGGASTESFRDEGRWADLRTMVGEVHRAGAAPVLCTSVERRHFLDAPSSDVLEESLEDYPEVVREL